MKLVAALSLRQDLRLPQQVLVALVQKDQAAVSIAGFGEHDGTPIERGEKLAVVEEFDATRKAAVHNDRGPVRNGRAGDAVGWESAAGDPDLRCGPRVNRHSFREWACAHDERGERGLLLHNRLRDGRPDKQGGDHEGRRNGRRDRPANAPLPVPSASQGGKRESETAAFRFAGAAFLQQVARQA